MASERSKKTTVESLYVALASGDAAAATAVLAVDVEWWFHGPPGREHMMRVLTGAAGHGDDFRFSPRRVAEVGERWVVAEGWEGPAAYWVHVWTVDGGGVVTQFREYFNTCLTVRDVSRRPVSGRPQRSPTVWQSEPRVHRRRSMPGLLLAI